MDKKKGYEVNLYDDCSVEVVYNGFINKSIENEADLQNFLNSLDKRIKEQKESLSNSTAHFSSELNDRDKFIKELTLKLNEANDLCCKLACERNDLKKQLEEYGQSAFERRASNQWLVTCKDLCEGDVLDAINNFGDKIQSICYQGDNLAIRFYGLVAFNELKSIFPQSHIEEFKYDFKKLADFVFK